MKKYLSLIVLFSLCLIQIHGQTHTDFSEHTKTDDCIICEIVSHQSILVPTTLDLNFTPQLVSDKKFLISETRNISQSFISKSHSPRGPPVI